MRGYDVRLRGCGRYSRHKIAKGGGRRWESGKKYVVVITEEDGLRGLMLDMLLRDLDTLELLLHRGERSAVYTRIGVVRARVERIKGLQPLG